MGTGTTHGTARDGSGPDPLLLLAAEATAPGVHEVLQTVAEGVVDVLGFGVTAVSIVRGDVLEVVAVAGSDEARAHLAGHTTPLADMRAEIGLADRWGPLRFLPHDRVPDGTDLGWVPPTDGAEPAPGDWHPLDLLVAPLHDDAGRWRGLLSVDLPPGGRVPDEPLREALATYADQAARALVAVLERERLREEVRLAAAARAIVRAASAELALDAVVARAQRAVLDGLRADGLWLQTFDDQGHEQGAVVAADGRAADVPAGLRAVARRAARAAWQQQRAVVVDARRPAPPGAADTDLLTADERTAVLDHLASLGTSSLLLVPLGVGPESLGWLLLTRRGAAPAWTAVEVAAAVDIGHDLGRAVLNARLFEREHQLVTELQELDADRARLLATVAHELATPLSVVVGHLELLADLELAPPAGPSVAAAGRAVERARTLAHDLLLLARVGDPRTPLDPVPVDLGTVAAEVVELLTDRAGRAGVALHLTQVPAPGEALVPGDPGELDRVATNLVGNAVKYTPTGGRVEVAVVRSGDEVLLRVTDTGIGIAEADRARLFEEFFRAADPAARERPGTGLGLAIVARSVARHGGRVDVASVPGRGSTFTVALPAAGR